MRVSSKDRETTKIHQIIMNELVQYVEQRTARDIKEFDFFKPGDTIAVTYDITESGKTRQQVFRGDVIQIKGHGATKTFTIRKISHDVGVERTFPFNCPLLVEIKNLKKGRVRRARLNYLRGLSGKSARIREKKFTKKQNPSNKGKKRKLAWVWEQQGVYGDGA